MTVQTIAASAAIAASPVKAAPKVLGQADFIRLMTAQLKQQDPTDPVDSKDTIAQMAQFSSLSGLESINTTLKAIAAQLDQALAARNPPVPAAPTPTPA